MIAQNNTRVISRSLDPLILSSIDQCSVAVAYLELPRHTIIHTKTSLLLFLFISHQDFSKQSETRREEEEEEELLLLLLFVTLIF